MFWVLKRTVSLRWFFKVPTTCFGWEIRKLIFWYALLTKGLVGLSSLMIRVLLKAFNNKFCYFSTKTYVVGTQNSFFSAVFGAEIRPHSPRQKVCFFPLFWKKIPLKMKYSKKKIGKMWRQCVGRAYKFVPCISHAVNLRVASLGDR